MANAIPEGFHTLTPHLTIKGADRAIEFYKKAFNAKELSRHDSGGKVMHALLEIGTSRLMVADEFPEFGQEAHKSPETLGGSPVCLNLYVQDADTIAKQAEAAGARITMPVAEQFWGDRYGQLVDPFGHVWSVATHVKDMTDEEQAKAGDEFLKKQPVG